MIYTSIILFVLSAGLGLTILIKWLTKKSASMAVVYSHGIVAALALVLLLVYALKNPDHFPLASIILFVVAALGGFYMFFNDLKKKESPMVVAIFHALFAVAGLVALLFFTFA
jgi:hypothetical protein